MTTYLNIIQGICMRQTDRQSDWMTDRHGDKRKEKKLTAQQTDWLTDWLTNRLTGRLTTRQTDWLIHWLTDSWWTYLVNVISTFTFDVRINNGYHLGNKYILIKKKKNQITVLLSTKASKHPLGFSKPLKMCLEACSQYSFHLSTFWRQIFLHLIRSGEFKLVPSHIPE